MGMEIVVVSIILIVTLIKTPYICQVCNKAGHSTRKYYHHFDLSCQCSKLEYKQTMVAALVGTERICKSLELVSLNLSLKTLPLFLIKSLLSLKFKRICYLFKNFVWITIFISNFMTNFLL